MPAHRRIADLALAFALAFALAACGAEDPKTKPVAIKTGVKTSPTALSFETPSLVIERVRMTLADIDLERTEQSVECGLLSSEEVAAHLDCSDYVPGPVLLDLDLSGAAPTFLDVEAQIGTYGLVSFDISVPDGGDPAEIAYLAANPDMAGASVVVEGSYPGFPLNKWTFKTAVRGDKAIPIVPALDVTADGPAAFALAIRFDLASWFRDYLGNPIDPADICPLGGEDGCTAQQLQARAKVEQNVEQSIESGSLH